MVLTTRSPRCPRGHSEEASGSCARSRLAGALMASALLLGSLHGGRGQEFGGAGTGFSLHPPSFNLAEGAKIRATATCGEESGAGGTQPRVDLYCKLVGGPVASSTQGHTIQGQSCDFCDSSDPNKAHPASNAIDGTERWWQSPPLSLGLRYNEVNVTIDLGQIFHVAYVLIKFANSPRPDLWVLERSVDFGSSYMPWQYFANSRQDCLLQFGKDVKQRIARDDDVICTTEYSRIVPLENGEVVVRLVSGRPGSKHFMDSPVLRDFTKATNIRLRFLRTNTLLGHLISKAEKDPTVTRRYYYSIKDISIGGRCVCHGHANVCNVRSFGNQNLYQCNCQHNTCGEICDRCCPGYNQKPWRPANIDTANQCEPCNCHGHASDCYYDSDVDNRQASLDIHGQYSGGGVCINCQHNTAGINCEKCAVGYFRPYGVPKEAQHGCIPCSCNPEHSDGCEEGAGRCYCKPNFSGNSCERCAGGYYGYPVCQRIPFYPDPTVGPTAGNIKGCNCRGAGALSNNCDTLTGQCPCHAGYWGVACDTCAPGYFHYPFCQRCDCNAAGVHPEVCSPTGRCLCRLTVGGERCDQCRPGYHSFPSCKECDCDSVGARDPSCGPKGECLCRPNYAGQTCNQCAPNFYNYPLCIACRCSPQGSYQSTCDPVTGQCECRPGVSGQTCDRCSSGLDNYPYCQDTFEECDPVGTLTSQVGYCQCLPRVEGVLCDRCKPLFWNLEEVNPQGCIDCSCDVKGTISGIGECHQTEGDCHCKPNTCSTFCETCRDGYFFLDGKNYFGCRGCQCDVGGSVNHVCDETTGKCICRNNIEGQNCNQPKQNYYFPDLHQMKFEVEDGTSSSGRPVRFGYNSHEFPGFSWRGYAQMSSIQNEVKVPVTVDKSNLNLFRIILKYVNPEVNAVTGRITAHRSRSGKGSFDVKDIVFPPSTEPAFLTVPGKSFAEPFSLVPGNWIITISVEGVLLDYLVLLPSDYYEASILQLRVTQPCDYSGPVGTNCLVYQHLPLEKFTCLHGAEMQYFKQDGEYYPITVQQSSYGHPLMAAISGRQVELHFSIKAPQPGVYAFIFEYANEDDQQYFLNVMIRNDPRSSGRVNLYSCKYSFLCRSIVVDNMNRIAKFEMRSDTEIDVTASSVNFLLHTVCIIPIEELSIEYAEPKVHCIAAYGRTLGHSPACIQSSVYENLPLALLLDPIKDAKDSGGQKSKDQEPIHGAGFPRQQGNRVLLSALKNEITFGRRIPNTGRYVFIVHYYQTQNPAFPVSVLVDGGTQWSGAFNATYCPHTFGCRDLVVAGNRISLDITNPELLVTVRTPPNKPLFLESILLVPANSYTHDILQEKPLDKSFDFINICGENSFYIDPFSSPEFCKDSARSLVAYYNNGALLCGCHAEGSTNPVCHPFGGQCTCRPNIIGRTCSSCATGYYGFPYCRPCTCGRRLCDEITGRCICPPQTVKPACEACEQHTFSYHPLLGCEGCNCSTTGVIQPFRPECDSISGQCRCKPRISGRQCERCAPSYFHFPDCIPCDCNSYGTEPQICDSLTGVCLCKENTEGSRCDVCRSGSFNFDPSNTKGCIRCFCFGATDSCHSSKKHRKKFVDMRFWILEASDQTRVDVTFNPGSNSVVADVQELPPSVHSLHWSAPASYLGERISSYGGYLTYQLKSFGLPSEGMVLLDKRPDVLLTGRQMTVAYVDPNNPLPDRQYYGRVQLVESNFRHASSNSMVSREELMMILSRLESLNIRALYFTETQRLTLGEVGLEDITNSGSGRAALNVEICDCPPEYTGDSCQECAPGYYRENQGLYLGRCVLCRCNGHSTRCHDVSGICINCQHNTKGDHCELCKEGYSGNATQGSCSVCPCPLTVASNSFATGCSGSGRNLKCFCKPGYTGYNCGECAQGYYGNPLRLGGKCQPCNCGNNGQLISCDPLTGECLDDPKDTGSDDLCDSCVNTLLMDLRTISDELNLIKAQLQSINANSQALELIRALEARIREVKQEYDNYNKKLASQQLNVTSLDTDMKALKLQVAGLLDKAEMNSKKYEVIMMNADNTFRNASHMLVTIDLLIKNINILIENAGKVQGGAATPEEVSKNMVEAQRMLNEMRKRNFYAQRKETDLERAEAKSLLNRVRNNFQKHVDQHKNLIRAINKSLKDYEEKLNDLRDAMDEASGQTKQANDLNKQNAMTLEDIKNRVDDLRRQEQEAANYLKVAETSLEQTRSIVDLLQKSKEEYAKQAAQLYGAEQEVNEKVNNLSKAASKEPLVIMAEKHAQSLLDLASELLEIKKNTSSEELVRCAIEATNAYKDIIDAIKAAEEAADKAKTAADSALTKVQSEDLPGKAQNSLTDSDALLQQAKNTQKSFSDVNPQMEDIKDRLTAATDKKNRLLDDLTDVQNSIGDIRRDDIENLISNAKRLVNNADGIINNVQAELKPIREDVENLTGSVGTAQNTSFNEALREASNSVMKLSGSLPDVFAAMNRINSLVPLGNISESVSRIRELIQQARDAANKVVVPMRFDGNSGVEVRPPSNLEDLKAYTSLSFFLQRPQSRGDRRKRQLSANMFVMYLGSKDTSKDYIGIGVEDGKLMCVYNLGGSVSEINVREFVSSNKADEAILDRVVLERIYQYATLNYTKLYTSTNPDQSQLYSTKTQRNTLLDLNAEDVVFYVGGYPDDFTPPPRLNFPKYQGCIELDDMNQNAISLYNFRRTFNIDTTKVEPCKRYKEQSEGSFFEGVGYASISYSARISNRLRFEQTIQTTSDVGLLFFAEKEESYISLEIEDGILLLKYKLDSNPEPQKKRITSTPVNTGQIINILFLVAPSERVLRVLQDQVPLSETDVGAFAFSTYYLGGAPTVFREKFNIKTPPFRGCIRNVKNPGGAGQFLETYGVSRRCYSEWSMIRSAEFTNGGTLGLKPDGFSFPGDFQASFGFQTPQVDAMLLNHRTQSDELHISLEDGTVSVTTTNSNVNLRSRDKYSDGKLHFVSVIRDNNEYKLLVDDKEETENTDSSRRAGLSPSDIYIGGNGFMGCMTNVFISRGSPHPAVQNLFVNTEKNKVSLGMCTPDEAPVPLILSELRPLNLRLNDFYLPSLDNMSNLLNAQTGPKNLQGCTSRSNFTANLKSYRFGDSPASHLVYDLSMQSFKGRSRFSLEVQAEQSSGLILLMTDKQESSYLAIHMSKGRFVFSVGTKGNKLKIKSQEKYSDGKWHTVAFGWDGTNGQLVIDGLKARKGSLQKYLSLENMSLLYLGGVPSLKVQGMPKKSFTGCLKNVNINEVPLDRPSRTVGVTPCYDGSHEAGVYFAEGSGHVAVDKALNLGHEFEIAFDIRPESQESALLHIREGREHRLSLYVDNKKVTLSISNRKGDFQVSVTPVDLLCDGKWHTVTVRQKDNAVQLDVDKQTNETASSALTSTKQATLYIGGLPDTLETQRHPVKRSFVGCMKNLKVNKKVIDFSKLTGVHGAISLSRCPAA